MEGAINIAKGTASHEENADRIFQCFMGHSGWLMVKRQKLFIKPLKKLSLRQLGHREMLTMLPGRTELIYLEEDSTEAKKNPEFTKYIENALMALREAQFAKEVTKNPGDGKKA